MGFRDSNQDVLGFVHQFPERAKERIRDLAATQMRDGSAYHQYQPLTKKGNHDLGSGFNDDPLWLIYAVAAYVKETGDSGFLKEGIPFNHNENDSGTMFEHLKASFDHVLNNRGPHGLPLIGRADWNDCLNLNCHSMSPGESFQTTGTARGTVAESVLIAGMFTFMGQEYVKMAQLLGESDEAKRADQAIDDMVKVIKEHGSDPDWFLRAYDAFGNKIGSSENEEGQIYIEPQGFCVMAGIGSKMGLLIKP